MSAAQTHLTTSGIFLAASTRIFFAMFVEIIFWSTLGRFFDQHQLRFFWLTSDKTFSCCRRLGFFWPTSTEKHLRPTLVKKNLANVNQNISPIDIDRKNPS